MKNITYISAGAGSGKTYTLTQILADLISRKQDDPEYVDPEQVILTTFTVKAANEFREKAKAELYKIGKYDEAARLDHALIGTIDSVASQLIQKYWYTIGISPKQGVMDESAKTTYINQSIANIPSDDDLQFFAQFRKTFDVVDTNSKPDENFWKDHLKNIIEKTISFDITDYTQSVEESLSALHSLCDGSSIHIEKGQRIAVLEALYILVGQCRESKSKNNLLRAIDSYQDLSRKSSLGDIEWYRDFAKLLNDLPALPKGVEPPAILEDAFQKAADLWKSQEVYDLQEKYVQTIFRLAKEWNEQFTQYKLNKRIVDFSDIEHYMHKLLQDEEVAAEIGRTYTHLFVDEFQDCSPIQVKIFMTLAEVVRKSYWVGDTKQAIYGFRGSDWMLTKSVADAVAEKNGIDGCHSHNLSECWRSVPALVNANNKAFMKIFEPMFRENTERLVKLDAAMERHPELFATKVEDRAQHPLRYLNITEKRTPRSTKLKVEDLAQYIKNVVEWEQVKLTDIAVLGRTNSSLNDVQEALKGLGIDCDREMDLNMESKAVRLMMALTTLTTNPGDNLAKAEIAFLTQDNMGVGALIDSKLEYNNAPKEERQPWLSSTEMIRRVDGIRQRVMYQGIGALMETLAVELDVKNVMERWNTPVEQSMLDVKALIAVAKMYEQRSSDMGEPATPAGFNSFLEENEAKLPASGKGVQLLTYHRAKGLEWKYVFLLMDQTLEPMGVLKQDFYGIHHYHPETPTAHDFYSEMCIRLVPWIFGSRSKNVPDSIASILFASQMYADLLRRCMEENARLLYVGMTRASEVMTIVPWMAKKELNWLSDVGLRDAGDIAGGDVLGVGVKFDIVKAEYPENPVEATAPESKVFRKLDYHSENPSEAGLRMVAPSGIKGKSNEVSVIYRSERFIHINSAKMRDRSYADVGNCIHNIYAAIEKLSVPEVAKLIQSHHMEEILPKPHEIITAWHRLQNFLRREYGEPVAVCHERPFRQLKDDGTMVVGSIDYVYQTPDGSVLIDFKTFPQVEAVTDPESEHFAGLYAGQLDAYTQALEAAGEKVIKRLIYYPVSGMLVEVERSYDWHPPYDSNVFHVFGIDGIDMNRLFDEAVHFCSDGEYSPTIKIFVADTKEEGNERFNTVLCGESAQGVELTYLHKQNAHLHIDLPWLGSIGDVKLAFAYLHALRERYPECQIFMDDNLDEQFELTEENYTLLVTWRLINMRTVIESPYLGHHILVNGFYHGFFAPSKHDYPDMDIDDLTFKVADMFVDLQWAYSNFVEAGDAHVTAPDGKKITTVLLTNLSDTFAGISQHVCLSYNDELKDIPVKDFFKVVENNPYFKKVDAGQFVLRKMPEEEWKKLYDAFDVKPMRKPKTYLLRWNPTISSFRLGDYRNALYHHPDGFALNWSVYEWEDAHEGDRFYMLRTGDDKEGIVFCGEFTSEPYPGEDWAGKGIPRHYMDMDCWDCVLADEMPSLNVEILEKELPDINWRKGHSGQLLSEKDAEKLNELWNNLMKSE